MYKIFISLTLIALIAGCSSGNNDQNDVDIFDGTYDNVVFNKDSFSGFEFKFRCKEISVIYFRAGYSPSDYKCDEDWDTRLKIELSRSIKCPNIAYHLAGTKKSSKFFANQVNLSVSWKQKIVLSSRDVLLVCIV